jgi:hypothetical protein
VTRKTTECDAEIVVDGSTVRPLHQGAGEAGSRLFEAILALI